MCLEIYELDPSKYFSALGLAWKAALEKIEERLELLTDIVIVLTVGKRIRGEISHSIDRYAIAKYMKDHDQNN